MLKIHLKQNIIFLIKPSKDIRTKNFNDFKDFFEYSNGMNDIYKKIEECKPNKKRRIFFTQIPSGPLKPIKVFGEVLPLLLPKFLFALNALKTLLHCHI